MDTADFLVRQDHLSHTELRTTPEPVIEAGQIRLRVDRFALTANNITYAAFRATDAGEGVVLLSSASSKTAWGTCFR